MTTNLSSCVLHDLQRAAHRHDPRTDRQLLDCFLIRGEEAAFELLVRRHGPTVWGVCRRILRNDADAEDAFQATFLVLVRKAGSLADPAAVGNWLYGVAHNTALKAKVLASRRRALEREVAASRLPNAPVDVWEHLRPLLDDELSRLPDPYRAAVVLCDLEGRTVKEAARQLDCPQGTIASRLARGRDLLARRLTRRGVALAGGALALLLSRNAMARVPASLLTSTARAGALLSTGQTLPAGLLSPGAASLTEGVLKAMFASKFKLGAAVVLALGIVVTGAGVVTYPALAAKSSPREAAAALADKGEKKERGPTVSGTVKSVDAGKNTITLTVPTGKDKNTQEKTFTLSKDAKVLLEDVVAKVEALPEGKLSDLTAGTHAKVELSVDGKSAVSVSVRGPGLHGSVKSVDAAKNTLTIGFKGRDGLEEKTVILMKDAKVLKNDGLTKGDPDKEAKLGDLAAGTHVLVQLTVDRKQAMSVRVQGAGVSGTLKGLDNGTSTLTVTTKGENGLEDRSFKLAKNAKVDGSAVAGSRVHVRLSVFDPETAVEVRVIGE